MRFSRKEAWGVLLHKGARVLLAALVALFVLWPWLPGVSAIPTRTLVLYGFSILGEVMNQSVFPAFQADWLARTGERVELISSFASSGTITNQMILGVPAEAAILSLELDALRLVQAGTLPRETWKLLPFAGVLNRTPFIILVRPGNPKGIADFSDLTRPGVGVVHPDPLTSGGAQWAILAEYYSALLATGDEQRAYDQLLGVWNNVVAQASSARAARTQFENGFGDALITYEQEALRDRALGKLNADIVYPASTILSEHIVVVLDKNVKPDQRAVVDAFVDFLWGETAQRLFTQYGFRSVHDQLNAENADFGLIQRPFIVDELGGWPRAKQDIIDAIWKQRVLVEAGS